MSEELLDIDKVYQEMKWYIPSVQKGGNKHLNKKMKLLIKYCLHCKKVWEYYRMNNKRQTIRYDEFPPFGLPRKKCDYCKRTGK